MHGLGDGARAQQGRVAAFGVGGVTMTDVAALFSQARSGFFSSDDLDGSVGGALLTLRRRRFRLHVPENVARSNAVGAVGPRPDEEVHLTGEPPSLQ
jgi:hypothetical protein